MTIIGDLDRLLPQDRVEIHHLYTIVHDTLDSTRCTVISLMFRSVQHLMAHQNGSRNRVFSSLYNDTFANTLHVFAYTGIVGKFWSKAVQLWAKPMVNLKMNNPSIPT
jgi:hypothetical protein